MAATLLAATVSARAEGPSVWDAEFVTKASVGNMFEVKEAKLALDHCTVLVDAIETVQTSEKLGRACGKLQKEQLQVTHASR